MLEIGMKSPEFTLSDKDGNNVSLADRPGYSASALNVYDNTTGAVNAGDFAGNELVVVEGATNILVDAALTGNEGDIVSLNGKNYIIGVNAFANLTDAVNLGRELFVGDGIVDGTNFRQNSIFVLFRNIIYMHISILQLIICPHQQIAEKHLQILFRIF